MAMPKLTSTSTKMTKVWRRNKLKRYAPLRLTTLEKLVLIFILTLIIGIVALISITSDILYTVDILSFFDAASPPCSDSEIQLPGADQFIKNNTSSLFKSSTTISGNDVAIFYNVFFAEDKQSFFGKEKAATVKHALSIIKEQLDSRSASIYPEAPLYYMSLGEDVGHIPNCTNCIRLEHNSKGNEILTLSKLYQFCLEHPDKNVAYVHNKGSFHPSKNNDLLRRMLTKAVFSEECLLLKNPTIKRSIDTPSHCQCNVCSARFSPLPHFHTPGNMWVSKCSYVSKLIPPEAFGNKMNNAAECAPTKVFGKASMIASTHVGRGRYAAEHWVHSHPDVCPCDVYPGTYLWAYERLPSNDLWKPDLIYAPRFPMIEDYEEEEYLLHVRKVVEGAWFSLVGRIHEWKSVYGKIPDENSWVWNYYKSSALYGRMQ